MNDDPLKQTPISELDRDNRLNKKPRMTDAEILTELGSKSKLNLARLKFSSARAHIEQAGQQRTPLPPIEMRRMEFEAVREIAKVLGAEL